MTRHIDGFFILPFWQLKGERGTMINYFREAGFTAGKEATGKTGGTDLSRPLIYLKTTDRKRAVDIVKEETFAQMLLRILKERKIKASDFYTDACLDRKLFSKIKKNEDYQPKKNTAVRAALGLQLSLEETKKLLETAGYALSRSIREDKVISECIVRERRTVGQVNWWLRESGLKEI